MGLYGFQQRFVRFIQDGSKTHTIRAKRRHREKPGNTVHCYLGLRQKCVEPIGRFLCTSVEEIVINAHCRVFIDGAELSRDERNALAYADGFRSRRDGEYFLEMLEFWIGRIPFEGDIIRWQYSKAEVDRARTIAKHRAASGTLASINSRPRTEVVQ
jgi:hypothetical protein